MEQDWVRRTVRVIDVVVRRGGEGWRRVRWRMGIREAVKDQGREEYRREVREEDDILWGQSVLNVKPLLWLQRR